MSMLHWGRNESKLNVKVFINSKVDKIMGGQFTPLSTPSLLLDKLAIKRMHENACNPDKISFIPLATATRGGNVRVDDRIATIISNKTAKHSTRMSLDSGHFLHSKLSE
jgi:hypothetical protein